MRVTASIFGLALSACWVAEPLRAATHCALSSSARSSSWVWLIGEPPAAALSDRGLFGFATAAGNSCTTRGPGPPDLVFRAGFEDNDCQALVGLPCDGSDTDLCFEGTLSCVAGAPVCSDNTGSTTELCNGLDDDCDGAIDEDFVPNTNPACSAGTTFMGNVSGDTGSVTLMAQGMTEQWLRFRLTEDDSSVQGRPLGARLVLNMPAGLDYDLFVYCVACGGAVAGMSAQTGLAVQEVVTFGKNDVFGSDDSRDIIVEVRHRSHTQCASWSLTVTGNVAAAARPCDP